MKLIPATTALDMDLNAVPVYVRFARHGTYGDVIARVLTARLTEDRRGTSLMLTHDTAGGRLKCGYSGRLIKNPDGSESWNAERECWLLEVHEQ